MGEIITNIFLLAFSILLIGKGSDWFTDALIPLARKLGTTTASVGLILVSVAVSLPEVLVAVDGVLQGHATFSLGVTLGSIVCNIGLMIGICAFIRPLKVTNVILLRDGVFSIIVPILIFAVAAGGQITRIEGMAFLLLFIPYVINVFLQERESPAAKKELLKGVETELDLLGFGYVKLQSPWLAFIFGLILLLWGADMFTDQLLDLSRRMSLEEGLVGMTIGAVGPSIPNIAAAYKATKKGMTDVAISETLGSNVFTLLVTLGLLAFIAPIPISTKALVFDIPAVMVMSAVLFIFMVSGKKVTKREGFYLIVGYVFFLVMQFLLAA